MSNVLVVAELLEGAARKTTLSAITAAKQIAKQSGGSFDILAIGEGAEGAAKELAGYGAGKVLTAEIPGGYTCEGYAPTVAEVGKGYGAIVATASSFGKDLLPSVAAKLVPPSIRAALTASDSSAGDPGTWILPTTSPAL